MPNVHITQCDEPKYLPFACTLLKKLRATGLAYANQTAEVDGVKITVRKEVEHEYIRIEGGGGYIVLPADGVVKPDKDEAKAKGWYADLSVGPKGKIGSRSTAKRAGPIDWKPEKNAPCLSYDHGMNSRYRLSRNQQNTDAAKPNIYHKGREILTDDIQVSGATIYKGTYVIVANLGWRTEEWTASVAYAKTNGAWVEIGRFSTVGVTVKWDASPSIAETPAHTRSPWFFKNDGSVGASLTSSEAITGSLAKVVRVALSDSTGALTATFTVGEEVGHLWTGDNTRVHVGTTGPTGENFMGSSTFDWGSTVDARSGSGTSREYGTAYTTTGYGWDGVADGGGRETAVAVDFDDAGGELLITRKFRGGNSIAVLESSGVLYNYPRRHETDGVPADLLASGNYGTHNIVYTPVTASYVPTVIEDIRGCKGVIGVYINSASLIEYEISGSTSVVTTTTFSPTVTTVAEGPSTDLYQPRVVVYDLDARNKSAVYELFEIRGVRLSTTGPGYGMYRISNNVSLEILFNGRKIKSLPVWTKATFERELKLTVTSSYCEGFSLPLVMGGAIDTQSAMMPWHIGEMSLIGIADIVDYMFPGPGTFLREVSFASRKKDQWVASLYIRHCRTAAFLSAYGVWGTVTEVGTPLVIDEDVEVLPAQLEKIPKYKASVNFSMSPVTYY